MEKQLDQVEAVLQGNVRQVCGDLISGITRELHILRENVSKEKQTVSQPVCTLQEHTSKLQDYEDLQKQHRLILASCESLRSQNELLQSQVKELLAKEKSHKTVNQPQEAPQSRNETSWQFDAAQPSPSTLKVIQDHPELQAIIDSQFFNYNKLQKAHGVLLIKLRQHQEVITQLRGQQLEPKTDDKDYEARLAHLKAIIGSAPGSSRSPAASSCKSPDITSKHSTSSAVSANERSREIRTTSVEKDGPISVFSSPPDHSSECRNVESTDRSTEMVGNNSLISGPTVMPPPPINESQPEFISERPVKRRRIANLGIENHDRKKIKMEPTELDNPISDECQASIDLDAIQPPIILPGRRSEEIQPKPWSEMTNRTDPDATKQRSEPPRSSSDNFALTSPLQPITMSEEVLIKSEANAIHPGDTQESLMSPPPSVLSRWNAYQQSTPQRPVLQPRTPNAQIVNHEIKTVQLDLKKDNLYPQRTEVSENNAQTHPIIHVAGKAPSPRRTSSNLTTPKDKLEPRAAPSPTKCRTPLQRKRNNQKQRLRDKEASELSLKDFKFNPAMNQGFNQTFGGVNPNKETRNCSPDCSKPECCGSAFGAAVRSAGIASLGEMRPLEKNRLIQSYLGFPVSQLGDISKQAYQKLLGEALGKQFAEKYGRQQLLRADSPPGYWRAEFPSTQERAADGKKADEIEKATIEVRRREALRDGGLWVFRDE